MTLISLPQQRLTSEHFMKKTNHTAITLTVPTKRQKNKNENKTEKLLLPGVQSKYLSTQKIPLTL